MVVALVRHILAESGRVSSSPAALEVLAIAIRKGLDPPGKVAFAHRFPSIRSRGVLHRSYARRIASEQAYHELSFESVLRWIVRPTRIYYLTGKEGRFGARHLYRPLELPLLAHSPRT